MINGTIPTELPEIKSLSMDICSEEFSTTDSAMAYIREQIEEYYTDEYEAELIERAIIGLQEEYSKNIFPEMKVRWDAYPNHIGHLEFDGCFRCHNDNHLSVEKEQVISKDCNMCHIINAQGTPDNLMISKVGEPLEFIHPEDIDEAWKDGVCTDCHTGLNP